MSLRREKKWKNFRLPVQHTSIYVHKNHSSFLCTFHLRLLFLPPTKFSFIDVGVLMMDHNVGSLTGRTARNKTPKWMEYNEERRKKLESDVVFFSYCNWMCVVFYIWFFSTVYSFLKLKVYGSISCWRRQWRWWHL